MLDVERAKRTSLQLKKYHVKLWTVVLSQLIQTSHIFTSAFCADQPRAELPSLEKIRSRCMQQLEKLRPDHIRRLNPTPYKVRFALSSLNYFSYLSVSNTSQQSSSIQAGECERKAVRVHSLPMAERGASR